MLTNFDLNEVAPVEATVTVGGRALPVQALSDLPFKQFNALQRLYKEVTEDENALAKESTWDRVRQQIKLLIPSITDEEFDEHFSINRVSAFVRWHGTLTIEDGASSEKNDDGVSS